MKTYEICEMPRLNFAHTYDGDRYSNTFRTFGDHIEVTYIYDGELDIKVGNESFKACTGDVLCSTYDETLSVHANGYHCHHTVGFFARWEYAESDTKGLCLPHLIKSGNDAKEICELIDEMIFETYKYENSPTKVAGFLLNLLCKIDEAGRKKETTYRSEASILAQRAKKYIRDNIHKSVTQAEIAEHLGISSGYLCNVFGKSEGTTLMRYLNTTKLKSMQMLMQKENLKLREATLLYGYSDPNYVSALYRKLFGHNITDIKNGKYIE